MPGTYLRESYLIKDCLNDNYLTRLGKLEYTVGIEKAFLVDFDLEMIK